MNIEVEVVPQPEFDGSHLQIESAGDDPDLEKLSYRSPMLFAPEPAGRRPPDTRSLSETPCVSSIRSASAFTRQLEFLKLKPPTPRAAARAKQLAAFYRKARHRIELVADDSRHRLSTFPGTPIALQRAWPPAEAPA